MQLLVTGSTGYVGGRLVPELLAAGHRVRCLARTPSKLGGVPWRPEVEVVAGDVTDPGSLTGAMEGVDAAYYLVHSMGGTARFDDVDRQAAASFRDAAARAGVGRIVYLGGLGRDDERLSRHLQSRHEVGRVLADGPVPVTELRAGVVIGSGSASFEMLRYLAEVLPVMVAPRWIDNRCQPIAIRDVLTSLVGALDRPAGRSEVIEIGGADVVTYRQMLDVYAEVAQLRHRVILSVPVLTPKLSSLWVGLVTPLPAGLAKPLVESLVNEVVVTAPPPTELLGRAPLPFRAAVELALQATATTRWSDAAPRGRSPAAPTAVDPEWAGGSVLVDESVAETDAPPAAVFAELCGIGGDRGWYVTPLLWQVRGVLDKAVGGVGLRRGRRHPQELRVGDALDFWRVEAIEPDRLLRLRAEMRLPGEAWLEWYVQPSDAGSRLVQRATFVPRGLAGRAYWYALLPFHALIFGRMARAIADAAAVRTGATAPPP